jgi:peptide-methionine (S)-S-oxide reductase
MRIILISAIARALRAAASSALLLAGMLAIHACAPAAEPATMVPAPVLDEPAAATSARETAVLAGGCFWGVQGVFQHVKGVIGATSGYAGGAADTATYDQVGSGTTGHAESVQVTYDPQQISYGRLLQIYFSVAHDPTQVDRQGPDTGTQYRSALFPRDPLQQKIAAAYVAQLDRFGVFGAPVATRIEMGKAFYPAEAYHQDFLARNPGYAYIVVNDLPKIEHLQRLFPQRYRAQPVLVAAQAH